MEHFSDLFGDTKNIFNTDISSIQRGSLILAEPFMMDPNFKRAVVFICENDEQEGTLGFILNKPTGLQLSEAVEEVYVDAPLYYGGPVQTDTLHFFHDLGDRIEGSTEIADGLYWGGDFETVKSMLNSGEVAPDHFRFFVGYSGWDAEQLEGEMQQKAWMVARSKPEYVFDYDPDNLWRSILKEKGGSFKLMANFPEEPSLN